MNPISQALDELTAALQAVVGAGVVVSRDPGVIGPQVASKGVAVLIGPATTNEASSYKTWLLDVPANVVFDSPADPRHLDPAYSVAHQILNSDFVTTGMETGSVQTDSATTFPAVTVTMQVSTECQ